MIKRIHNIVSNKPFKIFYNGLVPRSLRKPWKYRYYDKDQQDKVATYWTKVINSYINNDIPKYNFEPIKKELVGEKIIWQFWSQGLNKLPDIVKLCFSSIDYHAKDYKIIRLSDANIHEYLDLPDFVTEKRVSANFKFAHFSDLLRVALLSTYGGVWLDASILLTDSLPIAYTHYDFFMYSRDPNSINRSWGKNDSHSYFNWREDFKVNHLNSIIFAKANSLSVKTMTDLLLFFWQTEVEVPYYFFFQILMTELKNFPSICSECPVIDDTLPHLLQSKMNKIYDEKYFKEVTSIIGIHKLTIHKQFFKKLFSKQTYYGHLKTKY